MKSLYYFGWFNDVFPEKLVRLLHEDITDRKSLVTTGKVMIAYIISKFLTKHF